MLSQLYLSVYKMQPTKLEQELKQQQPLQELHVQHVRSTIAPGTNQPSLPPTTNNPRAHQVSLQVKIYENKDKENAASKERDAASNEETDTFSNYIVNRRLELADFGIIL